MTQRNSGPKHGRGRWRWLFDLDLGGEGRHRKHGHGPWGWRGRFFEAGEVRLALLSLLKERPKHGYELMKELEQRSGGLYKASAGTVYPNLQQLEDEGLIRAEQRDDGKRVYTITSEGRAELDREAETVGRIWGRASNWGDWSDAMSPGAVEVIGPATRVMRTAFTAAASGESKRVEAVRGILNRTADELEKLK